MHCVLVAPRAMLLYFETVRIISTVLARNVIAILAVLTCQCDLWSYIVAGHEAAFHFGDRTCAQSRIA